MSTRTLVTADQLLALPFDGMRHELVEGELTTMTPAGSEHGKIAAKLLISVGSFVQAHDLGTVYAAETGFLIASDPDTVRAPDLAFVTKERSAEVGGSLGFGRGAPDLVAEVISPSDAHEDVHLKVLQWLEAGTRLVWVVSPRTRSVAVHAPGADVAIRREGDVLHGGELLPGLAIPVTKLFA